MATHYRLKTTELATTRDILLTKQSRVCPLCQGNMGGRGKQPVLDHDHRTGLIRDVLCRNCNGVEGKVLNLARRAKNNMTEKEWLQRLLEYYDRHITPKHGGILHPTYRTEAEKRLQRNKKAREQRAKIKASKE